MNERNCIIPCSSNSNEDDHDMNDSRKVSTDIVQCNNADDVVVDSDATSTVVCHIDDAIKPPLSSCERNRDDMESIIGSVNVTRNLRPSPVAKAFFAALDIAERQQEPPVLDGHTVPVKKATSQKKSQLIQKQIQTLGWRNRYSQHDLYPLTIVTNNYTSLLTTTTTSTLSRTTTKQQPSQQATTFHVRQIQRGEIDNTYGTGATVWPASVVLIKYLQLHATQLFSNNLPDMKVLDLGTGTGITSIAAALLGAKHIICTDGDANVVRLAQMNISNAAMEMQNNNCKDCKEGVIAAKNPKISIGSNTCSDDVNITEVRAPNMTTAADVAASKEIKHLEPMVHSSISNDRFRAVRTNTNDIESATTEVINEDFRNIKRTEHDAVYINKCSIEVQQYWWGTGTIHSQVINIDEKGTGNEIRNDINNSYNILSNCFDVILVSDCVLPKLYPIEPLIEAIHQMLGQQRSEPKPVAIVAYEYRYYAPYDPKQYVLELCAQKQLQLVVIPVTEHDPIYSIPDDIEIWHIYRI